jgi:hypothetical protein
MMAAAQAAAEAAMRQADEEQQALQRERSFGGMDNRSAMLSIEEQQLQMMQEMEMHANAGGDQQEHFMQEEMYDQMGGGNHNAAQLLQLQLLAQQKNGELSLQHNMRMNSRPEEHFLTIAQNGTLNGYGP